MRVTAALLIGGLSTWTCPAQAEETSLPHTPESIRKYQESAAQGDAWAQEALGILYSTGEGLPQDFGEATRWYRKAAENGNPEAQHNLAKHYANGLGVPRDYSKAYFWASLAVTLDPTIGMALMAGRVDAKADYVQFRDSLTAKLSHTQLSAAQKRCRQWLDANAKQWYEANLVSKPEPVSSMESPAPGHQWWCATDEFNYDDQLCWSAQEKCEKLDRWQSHPFPAHFPYVGCHGQDAVVLLEWTQVNRGRVFLAFPHVSQCEKARAQILKKPKSNSAVGRCRSSVDLEP